MKVDMNKLGKLLVDVYDNMTEEQKNSDYGKQLNDLNIFMEEFYDDDEEITETRVAIQDVANILLERGYKIKRLEWNEKYPGYTLFIFDGNITSEMSEIKHELYLKKVKESK